MKYLSIILILIIVLSCKSETEVGGLSADAIISKSIEVSGGELYNTSDIIFDFRNIKYRAQRNNLDFSLGRVIVKEDDSIFDLLGNDGFERFINEKPIKLEDSMVKKYTASVNSVHYFSVLPYGLNDKSVNKTLLGEEKIKTKDYSKIKVTFNQDGGGEDYEDVFVYWINKASFKVEYLAYSYSEDDGTGMRFREAYNERYVNGLRFVDYNNYKAEDASIPLIDLGKAFEKNQLNLLSKIELENIKVDLIDN